MTEECPKCEGENRKAGEPCEQCLPVTDGQSSRQTGYGAAAGKRPPRVGPFSCLMLLIFCGLFFLLGAVAVPRFHRQRAVAHCTICEKNLEYLGNALDTYGKAHNSRYPSNLDELVPAYLTAIPACPGAGKDTYSGSYTCGEAGTAYTLFCCGRYHMQIVKKSDFPRYTSRAGLVGGQ